MEGNGNPEIFDIEKGQIIPPWMPSLYMGGPSEKGSKPTAWAAFVHLPDNGSPINVSLSFGVVSKGLTARSLA